MNTSLRWLRASVLTITAALVLGACAGSTEPVADATDDADAATDVPDEGTEDALEGAWPVTIAATNGDVTVVGRPQRIVSLSAASTEILFAIGAGEQVIAVDDQSNHPPEAPVTDLAAFTPNVEAILEFEPDLVFTSFDPGDLVSGLEAAGVTTIVHDAPATLDGAYAQIEQVGAVTGNLGGAAEVVATMQSDIEAIVGEVQAADATYYHELDNTYYSVTSTTFIGEIYGLLGLTSIADGADGAEFGFPQLSNEYIVEADPTFVFLADTKCCSVTADSVAERPGWDQLTAVQQGRVVELDDDVVSRWGPRIVEFLRTVADAVAQYEPAS